MKKLKFLPIIALFCILFTSCGEKTVTAKKNLNNLYGDIKAEVTLPDLALDDASLLDYVGIKAEDCAQYVALIEDDATSGDMFFLFEAKSADKVSAIEEKLNGYLTQKSNEMKDYIPAEYEKMQKSSVTKKGNFLWLVVSADLDKIEGLISANFN